MTTHSSAFAGLLSFLMACGGAQDQGAMPAVPEEAALRTAPVAAPERSPDLLWWQGTEPACSTGELERRRLTWGAVFWCVSPGERADQSLQNDLGRLARCVHESVSAFQHEPTEAGLGDFLATAHESGLHPVLCSAVRRDGDVRTYNGRRILMERRVQSEGDHESSILYRFSCEECLVAAETTISVATQ